MRAYQPPASQICYGICNNGLYTHFGTQFGNEVSTLQKCACQAGMDFMYRVGVLRSEPSSITWFVSQPTQCLVILSLPSCLSSAGAAMSLIISRSCPRWPVTSPARATRMSSAADTSPCPFSPSRTFQLPPRLHPRPLHPSPCPLVTRSHQRVASRT